MSGCAGGNRIIREDVKPTIDKYYKEVLSFFSFYTDHIITGSYNYSDKKDFGDIDLIVQVHNFSAFKFIDYIKQFSDDIIVPFKSEKYAGKKYMHHGEIISILYPIVNNKGFVQIDNIFSLSNEETNFKNQFLSLPAIKQGLYLGLIKILLLEYPNTSVKHIILQSDEEIEYNLSSSALTIRKIKLTSDFKMIDKVDLWSSQNWNIVEELLKDYNLSGTFEDCLKDIKSKVHHPRSINRIKGLFKSMVSVKSGEVDTEKGKEKEWALKLIDQL
jgi:hypothetical protein